jgi:hypothetical protein
MPRPVWARTLRIDSRVSQLNPIQIVQANLEALNAGDVDGYMRDIDDNVVVHNLDGTIAFTGKAAYQSFHREFLGANPGIKAELLDRMSVGPWVVDELIVTGHADGHQDHIVSIQQIIDGKIVSIRTLSA